jgi:hypothetical protein
MILTGLFFTLTTIFNVMTIINKVLENMRVECVAVSYCSPTFTGATEENSRYFSLMIAGLLDVNLIRNIAIIILHYCEVQLSYFSERDGDDDDDDDDDNNNNNNTNMEVHAVTFSV